ncbi:unnamed protein product [Durusdinium trenchii]|uniref:Uncharacterized protein n=1 Tax=Durusdinium trenchii TaxID=1381693 RepID=A0ABP0S4N7_9DINO
MDTRAGSWPRRPMQPSPRQAKAAGDVRLPCVAGDARDTVPLPTVQNSEPDRMAHRMACITRHVTACATPPLMANAVAAGPGLPFDEVIGICAKYLKHSHTDSHALAVMSAIKSHL